MDLGAANSMCATESLLLTAPLLPLPPPPGDLHESYLVVKSTATVTVVSTVA